jgi:hypothetical protein
VTLQPGTGLLTLDGCFSRQPKAPHFPHIALSPFQFRGSIKRDFIEVHTLMTD